MYWTKTFIPTLKENPQEAESPSHQLLLRAGLVRMLMAGVYSYLPLGLRVLNNIQAVIRRRMNAAGGSELLLPVLQPRELWQRSGRDAVMGPVMIRFTDRRGRKVCLGPTHEEVITDLVRTHLSSYKQLPLLLYQIQTKIRDEIRPRSGLIRGCEFIMKDAYSFDADEAGLDAAYKAMYEAYTRIFKDCGLNVLITEADPGVMGGNVSHEYMAPAGDGEDIVLLCPKCGAASPHKDSPDERVAAACPVCAAEKEKVRAIEVGHIFKLGAKYSAPLGAQFLDASGRKMPAVMGCYGIGVSRLISAVIEQNRDDNGIIWPHEVSPYSAIILPLETGGGVIMRTACEIHDELEKEGIPALLDDRDERAGVKFKDAELIGIPVGIVIGRKTMEQNKVEIKMRRSKAVILAERAAVTERVKAALAGL